MHVLKKKKSGFVHVQYYNLKRVLTVRNEVMIILGKNNNAITLLEYERVLFLCFILNYTLTAVYTRIPMLVANVVGGNKRAPFPY